MAALTLGAAANAQALDVVAKGDVLTITGKPGEPNVLTYWAKTEATKQVIYVHQATGTEDMPDDYPDQLPEPDTFPEPLTPVFQDFLNGCSSAGQPSGTVRCIPTGSNFVSLTANLNDMTDYINNPALTGTEAIHQAMAVTLNGEAGADAVFGSTNGDVITGGDGGDDIRGNGGNDTLRPGNHQNSIRGGGGTDTVEFSSADRSNANADTGVSLDGFPNDGAACPVVKSPIPAACEASNVFVDVENITTGSGNDTIVASDLANVITTNGGNDDVTALAGDDKVLAGDGDNTVRGGDGKDAVTGGSGIDTFYGDNGADTLAGVGGDNKLFGGEGDDGITAEGGADTVEGNAGHDTISVGAGKNVVDAGVGDDKVATLGGEDSVRGGPETLADGQTDVDELNTGGAKDQIAAGAGDDIVHAGDGDNVIDLGAGNDGKATDTTPMAEGGKDTITGGPGNDHIKAGAGDNVITGDAGEDHVEATDGDDKVLGGTERDTLKTGGGNDYLQGGPEGNISDVLDAGGEDMGRQSRQFTAEPGLPAEAFHGDTVDYSDRTNGVYAIVGTSNSSGENCFPPVTSEPPCESDSITSAENLIGGAGDDQLVGDNDHANTLAGRAGKDILDGLAGDDILLGGDGDDSQLLGGAGGDFIAGGTGFDTVSYFKPENVATGVVVTLDGQRNDGANCARPGDAASANCENDNLQVDLEGIIGSDGPDYLSGSNGENALYGRNGNDDLIGNLGPDLLQGDGNVDTVSYAGRADDLSITAHDDAANDGGANEGDNVKPDVENIIGGDANDTIVASNDPTSNNNKIVGGPGNDTIDALHGSDDVWGDVEPSTANPNPQNAGTDTVVYGLMPGVGQRLAAELVEVTLDDVANDGTTVAFGGLSTEQDNIHFDVDNLRGGAEKNYFEGNFRPNILEGGAGADQLFGLQGNDAVIGGDGDDELHGGADSDVLTPGLGKDIISGESETDVVDYSERTGIVTVTFDNEPNDGEAGEDDNVFTDVEQARLPAGQQQPAPGGSDTSTGGSNTTTGGTTNNTTNNTNSESSAQQADSTTSGSSTTSTTVNPTTEQRAATTSQQTAVIKGLKTRSKSRKVLVRGRILVKAREGLAKSSSACKRGGRVVVTLRQGGKVVGKRRVELSRTCSFRAPVKLAKGTSGKVRVVVKFTGNQALKSTKRRTSLQVNG